MKKVWLPVFVAVVFIACRSKEEAQPDNFFPVLSFIKSQIAQVDTSLYTLVKIVTQENRTDTTYIKREEFKAFAKDFITLPDISSAGLRKQYTETRFFDNDLQKVILNYTPKNGEAPVRRQDIIIQPSGQTATDAVQTIFIDELSSGGDSTVIKKLTWEVDRRFRVVTIVQKRGEADKMQILNVIWNGFPIQSN